MSTTILPFRPAERINRSLTHSLEQRLLHFIAPRLPALITSDHLTLLGFTAQLAAGACYALARIWHPALVFVVLCLALNWFGDSLDGTLARIRSQQRPRFGFYVDHVADIFGATAMMSGLALSGFAHPAVAIAMLIAFLLLSAESFLATYTLGRFHLAPGLFGPTELRILLAIGTLWLLHSPYSHIAGHTFLLFDIGGIIGTACMLATVVTLSIRHTTQLFREEPLP